MEVNLMNKLDGPRLGTKLAIVNKLMRSGRPTRLRLVKATGWKAYSFVTNGRDLAKRFGGRFETEGRGDQRQFWIV
jgi:hypothetical protein